jgi:hypothetical protein
LTKCHKAPTCGIFLKRGFFRGVKYNILMCQMHKYIDIVYLMPTIGEIFVILLGFFGPFGPWVWGDVN